MKKFIAFVLGVCFFLSGFSQDLHLENKILKSEKLNYHISTKIKCEESPGILRLVIDVPDEYTFKLFNNPKLLIDSRGQKVKFYANFESGNEMEINYQLQKKTEDESEAVLIIKLEHTQNDEMKIDERELMLSHHELVAEEVMDSVTTHYEAISKQYENRDEEALARIQQLSIEKQKEDNEEGTALAVGYNSDATSGLNNTGKTYTVQILSLQYFNEERFNEFLDMCGLAVSDTYKKEVGGIVKIYVGKFNSYSEAKSAKQNLVENHNLSDSFIVSF